MSELKTLGYEKKDIRIKEIKFKRRIPLEKLYLVVANDVVSYTDIKKKEEKREDVVFYYVFVSKKKCKNAEEINMERKRLVENLKIPIENMYK